MDSNQQIRSQRTLNGLWTISGLIGVPTDTDYSIDIYTPAIYVIMLIAAKMRSGTLTLKVSSTAGDIVGLTGIAVSSVQAQTPATPGDASQVIAAGSRLYLTVSGSAAPVDFQFSVQFQRR